jgi:hypothetical protein
VLVPLVAAQPLGSEFRVNTYTTNSQRLPSVASDSTGNFVVAWNAEQSVLRFRRRRLHGQLRSGLA